MIVVVDGRKVSKVCTKVGTLLDYVNLLKRLKKEQELSNSNKSIIYLIK